MYVYSSIVTLFILVLIQRFSVCAAHISLVIVSRCVCVCVCVWRNMLLKFILSVQSVQQSSQDRVIFSLSIAQNLLPMINSCLGVLLY